MTVHLSRLLEPGYDPALDSTGEPLVPSLRLLTAADETTTWSVERDGVPLAADQVLFADGALLIGPLDVTAPTTLEIRAIASAELLFEDGFESGNTNAWSTTLP